MVTNPDRDEPVEITPGIVVDPQTRFGKPTIKGTRVTVEFALDQLGSGVPVDELMKEFELTPEQVQSAWAYAATVVSGEEIRPSR